ncbi:MAG TPA: hypothetical protein VGD43_03590, partial [Micromonospora sp.]
TGVGEENGDLVVTGVSTAARAGEPVPGFELVLRFRDEGPNLCPPADLVVPVQTTPTGWRAVLRSGRSGAPSAGYWWLLPRPLVADQDPPAPVDLPTSLPVRARLSARWTGGRLRLEPDRHRRVVLHVAR